MEDNHEESRLLARHLSGIASAEEEEQLRSWLETDVRRHRLLSVLREGWDAAAAPLPEHDVEAGWTRVDSRIRRLHARAASEPATPASEPVRRSAPPAAGSTGWRRTATRAAAVVLLALVPALWRSISGTEDRTAMLEVAAPRGQIATLRLPDGSRVVLAAESRLRYPHGFGKRARELHLEGMGYFEVAHQPERPFVVHARGSSTRVLGTRFVVRAYPEAAHVEVAVAEGRVALRADAAPSAAAVPLSRGQVGRLGADGQARVSRAGNVDAYLGWMRGGPLIQDVSVAEALAELERWHDVQLEVGDARLAARRITTPAGNASLGETLGMIALALDARYVPRGDTLIILPNR